MTTHGFDDEMLMAYADGELDAETAASVRRAIDADPAVAERAALFSRTRLMAKDALPVDVPAALRAAVDRLIAADRAGGAETGAVIALDRFRQPKMRQMTRSAWIMPLAASLVAAVIAATGGYFAGRSAPGADGRLDVAGLRNPALADALDRVNSGQEVPVEASNQRFRVIASFRARDGALCREFEVDTADVSTVISVACRRDGNWVVDFAVVAPADEGGYAPASSTEALDFYLSAIGAGQPLSADEELAALVALRKG